VHIRNGIEEELPAKFDYLEVEPGDKILYITGGGGGWGEPHEREIDAVRMDVVRGFASVEAARESYGVVMDAETLEVDEPATAKLRGELASARSNGPVFDFGIQRPREEANLVL
jgi:N-methylhydantoinase B